MAFHLVMQARIAQYELFLYQASDQRLQAMSLKVLLLLAQVWPLVKQVVSHLASWTNLKVFLPIRRVIRLMCLFNPLMTQSTGLAEDVMLVLFHQAWKLHPWVTLESKFIVMALCLLASFTVTLVFQCLWPITSLLFYSFQTDLIASNQISVQQSFNLMLSLLCYLMLHH